MIKPKDLKQATEAEYIVTYITPNSSSEEKTVLNTVNVTGYIAYNQIYFAIYSGPDGAGTPMFLCQTMAVLSVQNVGKH